MVNNNLNNLLQQAGKPRVIASDFDGTLTSDGKITSKLLEACEILKSIDIELLVVTGRPTGWLEALVEYLPIYAGVAENGGTIITKGKCSQPIAKNFSKELINAAFLLIKEEFPKVKITSDSLSRLTDIAFELNNFELFELNRIKTICNSNGVDFTWSSIHGHVMNHNQNKASGVLYALEHLYNNISNNLLYTIGDSLNDSPLFNPELFKNSFGVKNIESCLEYIEFKPKFILQGMEVEGFLELAQELYLIYGGK